MSYAIDLGIDCGTSELIADAMLKHFDRLRIVLPEDRFVDCIASGKAQKLNHWFVGIFPHGMGYGVQDCRPELVEPKNYEAIKSALYLHLSRVSGYRRAWFGQEAFDFFTSPTPNELAIVDIPELIYSRDSFPVIPEGTQSVLFSPGYMRVTQIRQRS